MSSSTSTWKVLHGNIPMNIMSLAPKIIYGTAWKKEQTAALVLNAVIQGFRAIDTAGQPKHYREDLVGEALVQLDKDFGVKREDLFIQTKYTSIGGQDMSKPIPYNPQDSITNQITTSFNASLSNLHTTYLDSYLLHSPLHTLEHTLEAWRTLAALQDDGRIRMIGVSNTYDVRILSALQNVRAVQVVQNRWYEGNDWDKQVVNYCKEHGIMYQSFWTLSGSPSLLLHPDIHEIANVASCTPAQAVFKIAQLEGITPLCGTTNEQHMLDAVAVQDIALPEEALGTHIEKVRELIR